MSLLHDSTNWLVPSRSPQLERGQKFSSADHKSCWDCEHIRIAGFPSRTCCKHKYKFIPAPSSAMIEARDFGPDTVADKCPDFSCDPKIKHLPYDTGEFDGPRASK